MLKASIDIGSNTTLLLIAEFDGQSLVERESCLRVTALGKDLDVNKQFCEESINATYSALSEYLELIQKYEIPVHEVIVTATEASRVASNASSFYQKVKSELGFAVKIISSEGEAFYTAMGVGHNFLDNVSEVVMMDIGGASTELIRVGVSPFKYKDSVSLPMGSVRATQWRLSGNFNENVSYVFKSCQKILNYKTSKLVCVAGTMTALGAMIKGLSHFEAEKINGQEVSYPEFKKFVQKIEDDTVDKIVENYPFLGKRAQSIVGGAWVACQLCEILGVTSIEISTRGLRHGTLMAANGIDEKFIVGEV